MDLAEALARKFARAWPEGMFDAFYGDALLYLCIAAQRYDPAVGPFKKLASVCITRALLNVARAERPKGFRREPGAPGTPAILPLDAERECGRTRAELVASEELPVGWELESAEGVRALLALLPPTWREVVRAYYTRCDCVTLERTGHRFGLAKAHAGQLVSRAHRRLRKGA